MNSVWHLIWIQSKRLEQPGSLTQSLHPWKFYQSHFSTARLTGREPGTAIAVGLGAMCLPATNFCCQLQIAESGIGAGTNKDIP